MHADAPHLEREAAVQTDLLLGALNEQLCYGIVAIWVLRVPNLDHTVIAGTGNIAACSEAVKRRVHG